MLIAVESLWSRAHGWRPLIHINAFGRWIVPAIHIGCPLLGLAIFWLISRHRIGRNTWKPVPAIVVCHFAWSQIHRPVVGAAQAAFPASDYRVAPYESTLGAFVVLVTFAIALWTVGAVHFRRRQAAPREQVAPTGRAVAAGA